MDGSEQGYACLPRARRSPPEVHGLRRDRLLRSLDEVTRTRLGLVVAPPGAGKTTLLAQWAATCGTDVAWLRVERDDGAAGRLAARLSEVLTPHLDPPEGAATITQLAIAVERRVEPLVVVLDDVHTVAGTVAEAELERLLLLAPEHVRIVLGSRRRPALNFARGELPRAVVVSDDDLAFRPWEVAALFDVVYRAPLASDDAAELTRRTAGWAAGLHLFHLSVTGSDPVGRRSAVSALARRSRYADDYLEREVLAELSRPLRRFLVRTAVFETLTPSRCDALLGDGSSSRRMLVDAAQQCAMVTADQHRDTFRVHEVLRRHLETQLEDEFGTSQARAWWGRAAEILQRSGADVEAVRARARAGDWAGVRRLLRSAPHDVLADGAARWTDVLPAWLEEDDPWASLVVARRLLEDGRLVAATVAAERAEVRFADDAAGVEQCRRLVAAARTWGFWPDLSVPGWPSVLRAATRRDPLAAVREAESLASPGRDLVQGVALLLAGDAASAEPALVRCAGDPHSDVRPSLAARLTLAVLQDLRRGPGRSTRPLDRIAAEADRCGFPWLSRLACGLAAGLGGGRGERPGGDGGSGPTAAEVALECDQRGDPWGALLVTAASAMADLHRGELDTATLERLVTRCRELDAGALEAWMRALHAVVAGACELPDAVVDAESAESYARFAAVPGAVCLSYAALAITRVDDREELLELASLSGAATGLGPGPWRSLGAVAEVLWGGSAGRPPTTGGAVTPAAGVPAPVTTTVPTTGPTTVPTPVPTSAPADRAASVLRGVPTPRGGGPTVVVRCFGEFRLAVGGEPLDLSVVRPRARSVLRMLAVHAGRTVHREQLADALWGDVERSAALHTLQVNLSNLRGLLSAGAGRGAASLIVREGDAYGLALPEGSVCDVLVFDQALAQARGPAGGHARDGTAEALRRAVEAYTGDLLPEEGPADWAAALREQYRLQAAEAAASLAALELDRGDASAAAVAASRSVEIDAYQDGGWRTLIQAYRLCGDLAAGERAQRRYAEVLVDLGVDAAVVGRHAAARGGATGRGTDGRR